MYNAIFFAIGTIFGFTIAMIYYNFLHSMIARVHSSVELLDQKYNRLIIILGEWQKKI